MTDKDKNRAFYDSHTPCDCADCKNFCMRITAACKDLAEFLSRYDIDIEKPFNLVSIDRGEFTEYFSCQYLAFGECPDDFEMDLSNVTLRKETDGHPSTKEYGEPNFVIDFSIVLPRIVDWLSATSKYKTVAGARLL